MNRINMIILWLENVLQQLAAWQRWGFVLIWYAIITIVSHLPAASSASTGAIVGGYDNLNTALRMIAHIIEFFILAVLVYVALYPGFTYMVRVVFIALSITFAGAVGDEFHQYFVLGRFARVQDVIVDTVGATVMMAIFFRLILWIRGKSEDDKERLYR